MRYFLEGKAFGISVAIMAKKVLVRDELQVRPQAEPGVNAPEINAAWAIRHVSNAVLLVRVVEMICA